MAYWSPMERRILIGSLTSTTFSNTHRLDGTLRNLVSMSRLHCCFKTDCAKLTKKEGKKKKSFPSREIMMINAKMKTMGTG